MSMDQQNTRLKVVNASNWQHLDLISPELSAQAHCPLKKMVVIIMIIFLINQSFWQGHHNSISQ